MAEQRRFTRIHFETPATLTVDGTPLAAMLIDISLKGALLGLPPGTNLATGTACVMETPLDEASAMITMEGHVAHAEGDTVGLSCDNIDLDSITHLRRLVELNLGDPELVHRELSALWDATKAAKSA